MTIAQQLEQKGIEKGIEQGIQLGRQEGRSEGERETTLKIARTMLQCCRTVSITTPSKK